MKKATKEKKVKHQSKRSFLIKNNEKNVMIKVKGTLIRIPLKKMDPSNVKITTVDNTS